MRRGQDWYQAMERYRQIYTAILVQPERLGAQINSPPTSSPRKPDSDRNREAADAQPVPEPDVSNKTIHGLGDGTALA